jgi:hypothetical protein
MSNKPDFFAYGEKQLGSRRTALVRIGVGWQHEKGKGLTIQVDALPLNFDGRIVLLEPKPDEQPAGATEGEPDDQEVFG